MKLWDEPVTDRTKADIEYVNSLKNKGYENLTATEKTQWLNGLKGALNTSDLVRIQNNIDLLSDVLELGLDVQEVSDLPCEDLFNNILINIELIINNYPVYASTPDIPAEPLNTYQKWNDIEQILHDVYEILNNNFYHYTNESYYAGEEIGLLL